MPLGHYRSITDCSQTQGLPEFSGSFLLCRSLEVMRLFWLFPSLVLQALLLFSSPLPLRVAVGMSTKTLP